MPDFHADSSVPAQRLVTPNAQDRHAREVSRNLTPYDVDRILQNANGGDPREQAKLATEILEKDWDIAQALQTRIAAVSGTPWDVQPADDSERARAVASFTRQALKAAGSAAEAADLGGFGGLIRGLLGGLLTGYAVAEIVWAEGGAGLRGFQHIPAQHFTFGDGMAPRLVTPDAPRGHDLPVGKFIVFSPGNRTGDIVRAGMIRPLAWLYAFKNLNLKDLLRYVEKFGMPFLIARLDDYAFDQERLRIASMIRHFASDGGGVFTKSAELELLQPSANSGEVYFRFLDYCERAVNKVLLGQTSTSDSRDANRSTASVHNLVRQDLRADDCRALAEALERQLLRPLAQYNFGPDAPVPSLCFRVEEEADRERESRILVNLRQAGYQVAPDAVEGAFGYPLSAAPAAAAD